MSKQELRLLRTPKAKESEATRVLAREANTVLAMVIKVDILPMVMTLVIDIIEEVDDEQNDAPNIGQNAGSETLAEAALRAGSLE